jgi:outer membrane lipoprotein SlyB
MKKTVLGFALLPALALAACTAAAPTSPRVVAMPGEGKTWDQFQQDQAYCEQYAQSAGPQPGQAENASQQNSVATTVGGAAVGAAAGAALGSMSGQMGSGAGVGAVLGALGGAAVAGNNTQAQADEMQRRYDVAYAQCMVGHGESVQDPSSYDEPPGYYPPPPRPYYGP